MPKRFRKHLRKLALAAGLVLALLVGLIVAAPALVSYGPIRDFVLQRLFDNRQVTVALQDVSIGWFRPTEITRLHVAQKEDRYELSVPRIANDVTLWQLLTRPRQLGNLQIERPLVVVNLPTQAANLFDSRPPTEALDEARVQSNLRRTIDVALTDATLEVHKPGASQPWGFAGIQLVAQLRPGESPEEGPLLMIPEAMLMNQQPLTQEMCDDLLKFAAPVVSRLTKVDGEVSLSLHDVNVPLARREEATGKGTLVIHHARLTGTPLVERIVTLLGLEPTAEVVTDCTIHFSLADRRVYHEGLDFGIGNLRVRTRGYVGLDETLDLIAEIPIPEAPPQTDRPPRRLLEALRGRTVEIPIGGTLDDPQLDTTRLGESLARTAESALQNLLQGAPLNLNLGPAGEVDASGMINLAESLLEGVRREGGMLDRLRERREDAEPENDRRRPWGIFRRRNVPEQVPEQPPAAPPEGAIDL